MTTNVAQSPAGKREPAIRWRACCAFLGLCVLAVSSPAHALPAQLQDLLDDPKAAQAVDFCDRTSADTDAEIEALGEVMENSEKVYTERQIASAVILSAGIKVASAHPDDCQLTFDAGKARFDAQVETFTKLLKGKNRYSKSRNADIAAAQRSISDLWLRDQIARQAYVALNTEDRTGAEFWGWRLATANTVLVDEEATALMKDLLETYDWIDRDRFGRKISEHAWLLVQHADDHPEFQALALSRMQPFLETGGVKGSNYAYLWDRVAINTGERQRYGTQPVWVCNEDGTLNLHPMEDPENVDARRAAIGMRGMQAELDQMAGNFCAH
ncbi:DUF6624 domain-containing protein [Henriciella sp. AS95]|uniref:DUF6624 domain-containing protein n=1 Tax=Henriciella sp. AS95 TaxID=3135782 RepID=UPI00317D8536